MNHKISVIVAIALLGACTLQTPGPNSSTNESFGIKSIESRGKPRPEPSVEPTQTNIESLPPVGERADNVELSEDSQPKVYFDNVVPVIDKESSIPGAITVIYDNDKEFRVDTQSNKIFSKDSDSTALVQKILEGHELKSVSDYAYPGISEEQMARDVELVQQKYGVVPPHRQSIHSYHFSPDVDTKTDLYPKKRRTQKRVII